MEFVIVSQQSGIITISMNRPSLHNAFNDQMIVELTAAFNIAAKDSECRVVILQSEGKNFSAGADLNWMKSMATLTRNQNRDDAMRLAQLMHTVYTLPKMVIAKVKGASYGGALGLISACDVAFADSRATFCLSEVKIGLAPAVISPYVIEAMGLRNARRYMLSAEVFDAQVAQNIGVVHEVCDLSILDETVMKFAGNASQNGPEAVQHCKQLVQSIAHETIGSQTNMLTADVIADLRVSEEGQEGLAAFLQKRSPAWRSELPDSEAH